MFLRGCGGEGLFPCLSRPLVAAYILRGSRPLSPSSEHSISTSASLSFCDFDSCSILIRTLVIIQGPPRKFQDNLSISRKCNRATSAEYFLPCKVTFTGSECKDVAITLLHTDAYLLCGSNRVPAVISYYLFQGTLYCKHFPYSSQDRF